MTEPRATACITFDFDAFAGRIFGAGERGITPTSASQGEFGGRTGIGRVLSLLERYGVRATFFIPGHSADSFPERVEQVLRAGHEIAHHGYCHETPAMITAERERDEIARGIESLERLTGRAPAGYRAPSWDASVNTIPLLLEFGFRYDSSLMGDDFRPYWCRTGDHGDKRSAYVFGQEADLVEIPVSWTLDDWGYYEFAPGEGDGGATPDQVLEIWQGEWDYMYQHVPGGVFTLTMHPQVTGRGARLRALEHLLQHVRSLPGTEFATTGEVAERWRAAQGAGA